MVVVIVPPAARIEASRDKAEAEARTADPVTVAVDTTICPLTKLETTVVAIAESNQISNSSRFSSKRDSPFGLAAGELTAFTPFPPPFPFPAAVVPDDPALPPSAGVVVIPPFPAATEFDPVFGFGLAAGV